MKNMITWSLGWSLYVYMFNYVLLCIHTSTLSNLHTLDSSIHIRTSEVIKMVYRTKYHNIKLTNLNFVNLRTTAWMTIRFHFVLKQKKTRDSIPQHLIDSIQVLPLLLKYTFKNKTPHKSYYNKSRPIFCSQFTDARCD